MARVKKVDRKDKAIHLAHTLAPKGYDFRLSHRSKIPHDGKCEAFLLALLAYRIGVPSASQED